MSNTIKYKGYHAVIEYSSEDEMLIGSVIGIQDSLNFHGVSLGEITQAFHDSIDGYLEMCEEIGRSPDKTYKGSFNVRISPELHRKAAIAAECEGITLNQLVQNAIEEKLDSPPHTTVVSFFPVQTQTATIRKENDYFSASRYNSTPLVHLNLGG